MNNLLTSLVLFFLMLCGAQAKTLNFYLPINFKTLDPVKLYYVEQWELAGSVYETLIKSFGFDGLIRPSLAESWKYQKNELHFKLKKDISFSNGEAITAKHVVESWKRFLIVDGNESSILNECFVKKKKLKTPYENHPSIVHIDQQNLILKIKSGCKDRLIHELGQPIYGIVNTDHLDKDFGIKDTRVVSGPFQYSFDQSGSLILARNDKNWTWKEGGSKIQKMTFTNKIEKGLDIIRISSFEDFKKVKAFNYDVVYSLPNVSWFLGFVCKKKEDCQKKKDILNHLRYLHQTKSSKKNFSVFDLHADSFFPPSVNCPSPTPKKTKRVSGDFCLEFKFGTKRENETVRSYLKEFSQKNGYRLKSKNCKNTYEFLLAAQYTNEEVLPTLDFLATRENVIHGISKLKEVINVTGDGDSSQEKLCKELARFNFLPISYGRSAMFYKESHLRALFFKSGGNFNLSDVPFLKEEKK